MAAAGAHDPVMTQSADFKDRSLTRTTLLSNHHHPRTVALSPRCTTHQGRVVWRLRQVCWFRTDETLSNLIYWSPRLQRVLFFPGISMQSVK